MVNRPTDKQIQHACALARERYAALGVETEQAQDTLAQIHDKAYSLIPGTRTAYRVPERP